MESSYQFVYLWSSSKLGTSTNDFHPLAHLSCVRACLPLTRWLQIFFMWNATPIHVIHDYCLPFHTTAYITSLSSSRPSIMSPPPPADPSMPTPSVSASSGEPTARSAGAPGPAAAHRRRKCPDDGQTTPRRSRRKQGLEAEDLEQKETPAIEMPAIAEEVPHATPSAPPRIEINSGSIHDPATTPERETELLTQALTQDPDPVDGSQPSLRAASSSNPPPACDDKATLTSPDPARVTKEKANPPSSNTPPETDPRSTPRTTVPSPRPASNAPTANSAATVSLLMVSCTINHAMSQINLLISHGIFMNSQILFIMSQFYFVVSPQQKDIQEEDQPKPGLNTPGVTNQRDQAALKSIVIQKLDLTQAQLLKKSEELQCSIALQEKHIQEEDVKAAAAATSQGKVCPCCLPFLTSHQ